MAMKKATLPGSYVHGRKIYTPEDERIPEELFDSLVEQEILEPDGDPAAGEKSGDLFEGLSEEQIQNLHDAGLGEPDAIASATEDDLQQVEKIGQTTAKKLKERAS